MSCSLTTYYRPSTSQYMYVLGSLLIINVYLFDRDMLCLSIGLFYQIVSFNLCIDDTDMISGLEFGRDIFL